MADKAEASDNDVGEALTFQHKGDLIEQAGGEVRDSVFDGDIAEEGNFLEDIPRDRLIAAAHNDIGLNTEAEQFLSGVLGRFGFKLAGAWDRDDQRDMDKHDIMPAAFGGDLSDRFQEWLAFDIAYGAADFDDSDVGIRGIEEVYPAFDFAGDMRDNLDGTAQEIAAAFLVEDIPVDLTGGDGGIEIEVFVDKSFIVAQVEVCFGAVVGDEDLAMLVRVHGTGIDVKVGVEFLDLNAQAALFKQASEGGGGDTLTESGDHAAGDENIFNGHKNPSLSSWKKQDKKRKN